MSKAARAKSLMITGTSSDVGKSLLTTVLIAVARSKGLAAAPFKAINISNNARATEFGEVPTAQYLQAIAAGLTPHPRFSPLLVKFGKEFVDYVWKGRSLPQGRYPDIDSAFSDLEGQIDEAYEELREEGFELIVVEGMGAIVEPHMRHPSPANLRLSARHNIPMLLVCDDSRGGTYASVVGAISLLSVEERQRLAGILINKVYDRNHWTHACLKQALAAAGFPPVLGSINLKSVALPAEDGANPAGRASAVAKVSVEILKMPSASNLDEFAPLVACPDIAVRWVVGPDRLDADMVIVPGCRDVPEALAWIRKTGLESSLIERISRQRPVVAICGGAQLMTRRIFNAEGLGTDVRGMSLLEAEVLFDENKTIEKKTIAFSGCRTEFWSIPRQDLEVYEIHHGRIVVAQNPTQTSQLDGIMFHGPLLATIYHGIFENGEFARALTGVRTIGNVQQKVKETVEMFADDMDIDSILARATGW